MDVEQYRGLLILTAGTSLFIIMLLVLRTLAERNKMVSRKSSQDEWLQREPLIVLKVLEETHDIKSFVLKRESGQSFPTFKAGQFLSFQIGDNEKQTRSYSISSSAENLSTLTVSVKKLKDGVGSTWFHSLKAGDKVLAYPPSGHFVDDHPMDVTRVYVAGGIGITPAMSMILTHLDRGEDVAIHLFYGMRSRNDMAYHKLLEYLASKHRNLKYHPILSNEDWEGDRGYINLNFIKSKLSSLEKSVFYICGPEVMSENLIGELMNSGISEDQIFNEKFASPTQFDPEKIPVRNAVVNISGQKLNYSGKQTLLEFLEDNNMPLPFACRTGVCGTCKCAVKGKVVSITQAGLRRDEIQKGYVLACVAFPEGEVEVNQVQ